MSRRCCPSPGGRKVAAAQRLHVVNDRPHVGGRCRPSSRASLVSRGHSRSCRTSHRLGCAMPDVHPSNHLPGDSGRPQGRVPCRPRRDTAGTSTCRGFGPCEHGGVERYGVALRRRAVRDVPAFGSVGCGGGDDSRRERAGSPHARTARKWPCYLALHIMILPPRGAPPRCRLQSHSAVMSASAAVPRDEACGTAREASCRVDRPLADLVQKVRAIERVVLRPPRKIELPAARLTSRSMRHDATRQRRVPRPTRLVRMTVEAGACRSDDITGAGTGVRAFNEVDGSAPSTGWCGRRTGCRSDHQHHAEQRRAQSLRRIAFLTARPSTGRARRRPDCAAVWMLT